MSGAGFGMKGLLPSSSPSDSLGLLFDEGFRARERIQRLGRS